MRMHVASVILIALLLGITSASASEIPAFVQSQHQTTLRAYLAKYPYYYIAPESLCGCEEQLSLYRKQEPEFQPYYAVGDINDDGIADFAVGLLDNRKSKDAEPMLTLVIFHGPFPMRKVVKDITVFKNYRINRPQEILAVFKSRVEEGHRLPARLDIGPGPFGSDDVHIITYDKKLKKYSVKYFYDES